MAINTADNTKMTHNFNLRYPTPYREMFRTSAKDVGLDEAWVLRYHPARKVVLCTMQSQM